jgi:hypothetical protein
MVQETPASFASSRAHDFFIIPLLDAAVPGAHIVQHHRCWRKIKRNIIAKISSWRDWHGVTAPVRDQACISDTDEVGIDSIRVTAVQTIP